MKRKNLVCGAVVLLTAVTAIGVSGCKKKGEEVVAPVETIEAVVETTEAAPEFNWTDMEVPEVFDVEMIKNSFLLAEPRASADRLQPVSTGDIFPIHFDSRGLVGELDGDYYGTELADGTIGYLDGRYFEWVIVDEADIEDEVLAEPEVMEETAVASIQSENSDVAEETVSSNVESQVTAETVNAVVEPKVPIMESQTVVQAKPIQSSGMPDASQMTTEELVAWLNSQGVDAQIGIGQAEDFRDSSDYATYDFQAEINPNMTLE